MPSAMRSISPRLSLRRVKRRSNRFLVGTGILPVISRQANHLSHQWRLLRCARKANAYPARLNGYVSQVPMAFRGRSTRSSFPTLSDTEWKGISVTAMPQVRRAGTSGHLAHLILTLMHLGCYFESRMAV